MRLRQLSLTSVLKSNVLDYDAVVIARVSTVMH